MKNQKNFILKEQIFFHIPHSSLNVPKYFLDKLLISLEEFQELNVFNSDIKVDKLVENIFVNKVIFKYSRMFCDVERFEDENIEPMAKKGMGIVYTNAINGDKIINVTPKYKKYIIDNYYRPHHNKLNHLTDTIINKFDKAYIFDLHSFSDDLAKLTFGPDISTPDICLGIEKEFEDESLTKYTLDFFEKKGYSVEINSPYTGTLIPSKHYFNKDTRIKGIMIEINKRIYLNNNFNLFQNVLEEYFETLIITN